MDKPKEELNAGDALPMCDCSSLLERIKGEDNVCELHSEPKESWEEEFYNRFIPDSIKVYSDKIDINTLGIPIEIKDIKLFIKKTRTKVLKEVVLKIKAHNFQFFTAKEGIIMNGIGISQIGKDKVCIDAHELNEFLDSLIKEIQ